MKRLILLSFVQLFISLRVSCKAEIPFSRLNMNENTNPISGNILKIKIGERIFNATLLDNPTAIVFKALLPLTVNMNELNNNEKYAQLSQNIPTNASVPASIQAGDLMMYGSSTLVLFYKGFSTSYSYTKIGKIDDITGLKAALGTGDISITFEL